MKTLKFRIPRTDASITALIDSLKNELTSVDIAEIPAPGATAILDTDINVIEIKKSENSAPAVPASGVTGVDLDSDGLPWDPRIHGASKKKLARGGTWKLLRGVDETLVAQVKAELVATMAAAPADKIDYEAESAEIEQQAATENAPAPAPAPNAPAPAPVADPIYITVDGGEFTGEQLTASGWTAEQIATLEVKNVNVSPMTFPELMNAITTAGLSETLILNAVTNQDIQSLPLLAARPDLIPAVYAELFPA